MPRAHRELVFSSRGRRHEARPVSNFRRFRGRLPLALASTDVAPKSRNSAPALRAYSTFGPGGDAGATHSQTGSWLARKRELRVAEGPLPRRWRAQSETLLFVPPPPLLPPTGDSPWPAAPGLKAPASLPTGVNCIPFRKNFWSPQPKVPAAISVENRWLPRAHRELVFSSRGRRHEARPVSNFRRFRGRPPLALAC